MIKNPFFLQLTVKEGEEVLKEEPGLREPTTNDPGTLSFLLFSY